MAVICGVPDDDGISPFLKCQIQQEIGGQDVTVVGYMTEECQLALRSHWASPFEGDSVGNANVVDKLSSLGQVVTEFTSKVQDNSQQTWEGIDPPEVTITLRFMAYTDPVNEVDLPIRYLMQMVSPELNETLAINKNGAGRVPSAAYFSLGRRFISPMRISEVSCNVNSARTKDGNYAYNTVSITAAPKRMINKSQIPNYFF